MSSFLSVIPGTDSYNRRVGNARNTGRGSSQKPDTGFDPSRSDIFEGFNLKFMGGDATFGEGGSLASYTQPEGVYTINNTPDSLNFNLSPAMQNRWDSDQAAYNYFAGITDPGLLSTTLQQWAFADKQLAKQEAGNKAGLDLLYGTKDQLANDPRFNNIMAGMDQLSAEYQRRGQPDYKAITDMMLNPQLHTITGGAARQMQFTRDSMAGRGLGRSGASASLQGAIMGQASRGHAQVRGNQASTNAEMRAIALGARGRLLGNQAGLVTSRDALRTGVDTQIAAYERDPALSELDFFEPFNLQRNIDNETFYRDFMTDSLAEQQRNSDALSRWGWDDGLDLISIFTGKGDPRR